MALQEYDDYEQSERLRQWLRRNSVSVLVGIAVGLLLIFGWQRWKAYRSDHRAQASEQYALLRTSFDAGKQHQADAIVTTLRKGYDDTGYAIFAAALQAHQQFQAGHLGKARAALAWAAGHADNPALKGLMQLRLARVELAQGQASTALKTLDAMPKKDYPGLSSELRGDALLKLGRPVEARKAYQAALTALRKDAPQRDGVQMKIDNLAIAGKQGA